MPGGNVEAYETVAQAAVREQKEESSLSLSSPWVMLGYVEVRNNRGGGFTTHLCLKWYRWEGEALPSDSHSLWDWFSYEEAMSLHLAPHTKEFFKQLWARA